MIVINLFGAPGAGKSTGAAYIFAMLKMIGYNAELISEFAKDKVWEENPTPFKNQAYIFGKQSYRQSRCDEKVDILITDSPLPLSIIYNNDFRLTENFNKTVMDVFNSYNNINYFLERTKPYNTAGRLQSELESDKIATEVKDMLSERGIDYISVNGDIEGYNFIVSDIVNYLEKKN